MSILPVTNVPKSVIPTSYLLAEDGSYLLQENGDRILLEESGEPDAVRNIPKS